MFFLIRLPLILTGLLCGCLFALIVSFAGPNTELFFTGPSVTTLPIEILSFLQVRTSAPRFGRIRGAPPLSAVRLFAKSSAFDLSLDIAEDLPHPLRQS